MKTSELRNKNNSELLNLVLDLRKESFNLRFQRIQGQIANSARFKEVRRTIAKIKTVLTERKQSSTEK